MLIVVFLAGCLLGIGGSWYWLQRYTESGLPDGPPPPRGHRGIPEMLQMTPEQEKRFGEIMRETRRQLDSLQMEQRPKIEEVLEQANARIAAILNEEQRNKFRDFIEDIKRWRSRDRRDRHLGPPRRRGEERPPDSRRRPLEGPGADLGRRPFTSEWPPPVLGPGSF